MKTKLKNLFIWSSLGGLVLSATITISLRSRRQPSTPIVCKKIPGECVRFTLWTVQFWLKENANQFLARDIYVFQLTLFRVWSVLDFSPAACRSAYEGGTVYHVTHLRRIQLEDATEDPKEERLLDRFYGVVTTIDEGGKACGKNVIARGQILEIRKCRVGGATNGIETGETHRSVAPVLNYRFEYTPIEKRFANMTT